MTVGILDHIRSWWRLLRGWLAAACAVFTMHLFATQVHALIDAWTEGHDLDPVAAELCAVYFALLLASVVWLFLRRPDFEPPRTRYLRVDAKPRKRAHLVLFLSNLNLNVFPDGLPQDLSPTGNLEADLDALAAQKKSQKGESKPPRALWSWEMALRAIHHHLGPLKAVTVVCSTDSILQFELFRTLLCRYKLLPEVKLWLLAREADRTELFDCTERFIGGGGWSFEQFDTLSRALADLLDIYRARGVPERQIMIDLTGGQKVNSVVAAAVTFNRRIKNQYVQTNCPWKVIGYDILWDPREPEVGG
jgi:hypothetical protein